MEGLFYIIMLVAAIGVFLIGGYGLLKLGHLINDGLRRGRDLRWILYVVAVLGLGLFVAACFINVNGEWIRALGILLLVLALVTLINYKGK